jgi:sugar lactone lactonase YvrE
VIWFCIVACLGSIRAPIALAVTLNSRDIIVADPGRDQIIRVNPSTGAETVISSGGHFYNPADLVLDATGNIFVAEYINDGIVRVNPANGAQTVLAPDIEGAAGIAWDGAGQLLVTADYAINGTLLRVNPVTGAHTTIADHLGSPRGIAVAADGTIYIADFSQIVKVNPTSGAVSILSSGALLDYAFDVAIDSAGDLLIANEHGPGVVRVNPVTGAQSLLVAGSPPFHNPMGIAIDTDGSLLVADQGVYSEYGGILRVDPLSGATSVVSPSGWLHGIAVVVPEPAGAVSVLACLASVVARRPLRRTQFAEAD